MKNIKKNFVILLVLFITILFISLKDDFENIIIQLYSINFWWFLLACFAMVFFFIFRTFEMHELILREKKDYPFRRTLGIVVLGQFFANLTPSSFGTQPAQIYLLQKEKIKATSGTKIIIRCNTNYQIAFLIISLVTIILAYRFNIFSNMSNNLILTKLGLVGFSIHLFVLFMLLGVSFSKGTNSFIIKKSIKFLTFFKIVKNEDALLNKWDSNLNEFHEGTIDLFKDKALLFKGIVFNMIAIILFYTIPIIIVYAIGDFGSLNVLGTTVASSYTNLVSSFMPSPGGTGGFEYFFTQFFGTFLIGATLTTLMLVWRFITYYLVIIAGLIMLIFYKEKEIVL